MSPNGTSSWITHRRMHTGMPLGKRLLALGLGFSLAVIVTAAFSGCGNNLQAQVTTASAESYSPPDPLQAGFNNGIDPITGDTEANVTNYACPVSANVTPNYDWQLNGTGYYTVCPARANSTDILIHGQPVDLGSILCIFPANAADPNDVSVARDATTGLPLFQCVQITSTGAYASFASSVTYNSTFIVDMEDVYSMQTCLAQANSYMCPKNYSFGLFRAYSSTGTGTGT